VVKTYYSPLRYPGGKSWLAPELRAWLADCPATEIIELFAGGAFASLLAVVEGFVSKATLVEMDPAVCAVWRTIFSPSAKVLCNRVLRFPFEENEVRALIEKKARNDLDLAFQTIVLNRARRGGILAEGAGFLKSGERSKGVSSRWYPETLCKRITLLNSFSDRFQIVEGDALQALRRFNRRKTRAKIFVDPPYFKLQEKGVKPLYRYNHIDHKALFAGLSRTPHDFLLTYDVNDQITEYINEYSLSAKTVVMRTTHAVSKEEFLISKKLMCQS
jgi:DNA adenine methylase